MCTHNKLKVVEFNEDSIKVGKNDVVCVDNSNPWSLTVDGCSKYSYAMGRIYECEECEKQFVIQSMFELPKQYKNKEKNER